MVKQEPKKQNSFIKWITATIFLVAMIIAGSFIGGTFYPNVWTVEKLEQEFHEKN